jgi:hypothetical protein
MKSRLASADIATKARRGAAAVSAARVALGVTALAFPSAVARPWLGTARDDLAARVLGRALGARDIALGLGALAALRSGGPARHWLAAGALSDALDIASSLAAWQELPRVTRWLVVASAGGATLAGVAGALAEHPTVAAKLERVL